MRILKFSAIVMAAGLANPAHAVTTIARSTLSGGATGGVSLHHLVRSTAAQAVISPVASTHHAIHPGFWWPGQFSSGLSDAAGQPSEFALRSVYPNPFSAKTEIRYDVPVPGGNVSLRVYDVRGRLVRDLVRDASPAGAHRVLWDGRNESGHRARSGLYFLSFVARGHEATRKLVLLP